MSPNTSLSPGQLIKAVAAVALGGALGTLLRDLLLHTNWLSGDAIPRGSATYGPHSLSWTSQIPWMLLLINFVGVLVATAVLVGPLRHHDPNDLTRLVVITGFFGGFTSYSGLFVDISTLWHLSVSAGIGVLVGAVLSGVVAGWLGLKVRLR
jgi:fluoride ion exporter CrcB/FEX